MEINFDAEKHEYTVDGKVVPSVTQICRFYQVDSAGNADKYLRDSAADRGTRVHELTVAMDYGEYPYEVDYDIQGYILAYKRFLRDNKVDWLGIEECLSNGEYAGTVDRYGYLNGKVTVLDIKTSSKINHAYVTSQLQGYRNLIEEEYEWSNEIYVNLVCLHLMKDGTYEMFNENYFDGGFVNALEMHEYLRDCKGVKI